ncbi:MAG: PASTA domain-containing protein, partial [Daejeonella sp.]
IVVLNNPKGAYYAALVAGPVFREIADKVYAGDVQMYDIMKDQKFATGSKMPSAKAGQKKATQQVYNVFGVKPVFASNGEYINAIDSSNGGNKEVKITEGSVPNVTGMGLKDALYLIGNSGLRPLVKGSGKVIRQSLVAGLRVNKGYPIVLELE